MITVRTDKTKYVLFTDNTLGKYKITVTRQSAQSF